MAVTKADIDRQLPLVRRGYDPYEVQRLVGQLSNELHSATRANEELRERVARLERHETAVLGAAVGALAHSAAPVGLDQAEGHALLVQPIADTTDARREAEAILRQARIDAARIVDDARAEAAAIAQQHALTVERLQVSQAHLQLALDGLGRPAP